MSLQTDLANAIARMENVNPSYNNPGGIWDMSTNSIKRYSTYQEGYNALLNQVQLNINRGLTLEEFFGGKEGVYYGYAPLGHGNNDPERYASTVGNWLGIRTDTPLINVGVVPSYSVPAPSEEGQTNPFGSGSLFPTFPEFTTSGILTSGSSYMPIVVGGLVLLLGTWMMRR